MKKHIVMSFDIDSETAVITNCKADEVIGKDRYENPLRVRIMYADDVSINSICEQLRKTLTFDVLDALEY